MSDLYTDKINEFVDWVTGDNTWTGQNETGGKAVSGGSIRQLLQERLKKPFVLKEDPENNLYRMFSSEDAYQMWVENPSDNADLEIFNFVRPSEYKLNITINSSNKFIRYGDSSNLGTRIQYTWDIRNDEGESSEGLTATYTISSESTGKSTTFTRWYNKGEAVDFSIYDYLDKGTNNITIQAKGSTSGAVNNITYSIVLLQLNVTSSFKFMQKRASSDLMEIPCTFTRNNVEGTASIKFRIDEGGTGKEWTHNVLKNAGNTAEATQRVTPNLEPGQHVLQIWAEAEYNDGSVRINSNLLYFTFIIATPDISNQKYICLATGFDSGQFPITNLVLQAQQYLPSKLQWGYYTDALNTDTQIQVTWKLYEDSEHSETLSTLTANSGSQAADLSFIPSVYSQYDEGLNPLSYLSAYWDETELLQIPIQIVQNADVRIYETGSYSLKLSAYGKNNNSSDKDSWTHNLISTTFTGIPWNTNSGWYNNSFRTIGVDSYAEINYSPFDNFSFSNGKTIEIEFETEKVNNDNDKLIIIGNPSAARIEITPVKAALYANNGYTVIYTNYKSNERIKLAFIINSTSESIESGLAYIVNNGILERAASASGQEFTTNTGGIKIGGSNSGVRVYNLRVYDYPITYLDAYNNYVYDSEDKISIINNNNILDASGEISFDLCKNKLDTILISGDLSMILNQDSDKDDSATDVTIERICPYDTTKNFKINNVQIRKHGQSTLKYPIASMKFWLNKSKSGVQPVFEIEPQQKQAYNKNRYKMKDTSIPQNKFVLQANYADSSGVHNGGLMRLIQQCWFNAQFKVGNNKIEYKLRTLPQLFATDQTVTHTSSILNDVNDTVDGLNAEGYTWNHYSPRLSFPYDIRTAPDSFPCAVFYYDEAGTQTRTFLGQYVFMDDKKSDFLYGERSIYKIPADPFCLTTIHAKDDTSSNKIWNNNNVLRIEVLESNHRYSSYMSTEGFTTKTGNKYGWETAFEMIYPDGDDLKKEDAEKGTNKFENTAQPFIDWYTWLVSTRNNQQKFQNEAAQHLDLYKMAAYYIFILRFGLVDSLERNAQIKTYDGVHFHYEPWDMDIALGNKNDGGIAYDPPIDRNTKLKINGVESVTTYAYSGRSANDQGEVVTSNWLFDALEAWGDWMNSIVPEVADALYNAGLKYDNISKMFDEEYAKAWCELIYNKSGFFKYIESSNRDPEWLNWLQGARMTHRHWWLSTSMDYYDAKWFCGEYKNHFIYITANVPNPNGETIHIVPNKNTYMTAAINFMPVTWEFGDDIEENNISVQRTIPVSPTNPFNYEVPTLNTKAPFYVYGANFMETIDLSDIATGLDGIDINGVYSKVLGSPLKTLNIGVNFTESNNVYTGVVATSGGNIRGSIESLKSLQTLNIAGQRNFNDTYFFRSYNLEELKNIYAMGSGITNFWSSSSGNNFNVLQLPSTISIFDVNNTTWNNLTFWDATIESGYATITQHSGIPSSIQTIRLNGTSCSDYNSISLVRQWLNAIVNDEGTAGLANHTLEADGIRWTIETLGGQQNLLTYNELELISQLNGTDKLSGYIVLRNENNTQLTAEQLTQIKTWFGDTVFSRNSSGLTVDHILNNGYVQINIGGDVRMINGELYLNEGQRAALNATKFALDPSDNENGTWSVSYASVSDVQQTSVSGITERGIRILKASESADHHSYLNTSESQAGGNYDIKVWYTLNGMSSHVTIHMIGVSYPSNIGYAVNNRGMALPKVSPAGVIIRQPDTAFDLYLNLASLSYTATIQNISHTISRESSSFTYNTSSDNTSGVWDDLQLEVDKSTSKKGLYLNCSTGIPIDDTIYKYNVESIINFTSGKNMTVNYEVIIMNDNAIVSAIQDSMFNAIKTRWEAKYGETFTEQSIYRSDLLDLDGTLTFGTNILNVYTQNESTLFNYLPKIQGLVFTDCTSLSRYYTPVGGTQVDLFIFDNMPYLQTLNLSGCTGLTGTIDLSNCQNLTTVNTTGTTLNIVIPENSGITSYSVGAPTEISMINPTSITPAQVTVSDSSNIDSLELVNIPSNKSFAMFGKIMGIS